MLWAEADRMGGLSITQANLDNQNGVVQNEVKVNVLNRPYGGFPWLDVPQYANRNWYNAHNFYGDLGDLDAATLKDVLAFHDTYYGPNNAALVVAGDFDPAQARAWIEKYFGGIKPARSRHSPTCPSRRRPKSAAHRRPMPLRRAPHSRSPTTCRSAGRPSGSRSASSTSCCCRVRTAR